MTTKGWLWTQCNYSYEDISKFWYVLVYGDHVQRSSLWLVVSCFTLETTKEICWPKGEGIIDQSSVTRWFKKFCSDCKNLDNQARSRPKSINSRAMFQAIAENPMSSPWRVSGECSPATSRPWKNYLQLLICASCYQSFLLSLVYVQILKLSNNYILAVINLNPLWLLLAICWKLLKSGNNFWSGLFVVN